MDKILLFLSGKKTTIVAIINAVMVFLSGRNLIAPDVALLISSLLVALGLVANVATAKMYGKIYGK